MRGGKLTRAPVPLAALGGVQVVVCTCDQFKPLVEDNGLEFASAGMHSIPQTEAWLKANTLSEFLAETMQTSKATCVPATLVPVNV